MTPNEDEETKPAIGDVAAEAPETSTAKEAEVVGEGPDDGETVPADDAQ